MKTISYLSAKHFFGFLGCFVFAECLVSKHSSTYKYIVLYIFFGYICFILFHVPGAGATRNNECGIASSASCINSYMAIEIRQDEILRFYFPSIVCDYNLYPCGCSAARLPDRLATTSRLPCQACICFVLKSKH